MYDIKQISQKLDVLLKEKGVQVYEHCVSESEKQELNTEKADFSLFRTIFDNGVSVTVILDGKKGSASGNDLSDEGLEKVVSDAVLGAESSVADEANAIAEREEPEAFQSGCWEADMPRFYDCLKAMMDTMAKDYPKVNLMTLIGDHTRYHVYYVNSNGTRFENRSGLYHVTIEMSGSDGEKNTGLDYTGFCTKDLDTPLIEQASVKQHLEATEASLNSVALPGKFEGTVIFTPDCLGEFTYMLASNYIMGGVIMNGTSQWLDKLGQQVASEKITVSLKAQDERIADLQPFTNDGYKAENVAVIEKGVLNCFLLNLYAARKTGKPVIKNTSFAMVIENGDTPLRDMIASVDKGLIVGGFSGGEPGANGEFSGVAKNSFYVENGKIVGAVTETMINGNLEQVFKNVIAVSKEQVCDGGSVLPWLACGGIVISGK